MIAATAVVKTASHNLSSWTRLVAGASINRITRAAVSLVTLERTSMRTQERSAYSVPFALVLALGATACGEKVEDVMRKAVAEARESLYEEPIDLSREGVDGTAELTPDGDLLIDGEPVAMNAAQREAALVYREKVLAVAEAGLTVGEEGAALGGEAMAIALGSMLGGDDVDSEEVERKIKAEAGKVKAAAMELCRYVLELETEQARFMEIVPEFAPYAKEIDIDSDCVEAHDASDAIEIIST